MYGTSAPYATCSYATCSIALWGSGHAPGSALTDLSHPRWSEKGWRRSQSYLLPAIPRGEPAHAVVSVTGRLRGGGRQRLSSDRRGGHLGGGLRRTGAHGSAEPADAGDQLVPVRGCLR